MVNAINSWINNGCNYLEGVALYNQYGTDSYLKRILKKSDSDFNRQKLNAALVELRDSVPPPDPEPVPQAAAPVPAPEQPAPTCLPKIMEVTRQRDTNYAEIRGLHVHLAIMDEGENLRALAERIVRLGKRNALLWEQYNYLTENPDANYEPAPKPVMVDYNLINDCENIRKSLNKAERRYREQTKKNPKTLELIKERKEQLEALRKQIQQFKAGGVQ